jgi:hypothetical protein
MSHKQEPEQYHAPTIRALGSVVEMTEQQKLNKIGSANDSFTAITGGALVGDIHPAP